VSADPKDRAAFLAKVGAMARDVTLLLLLQRATTAEAVAALKIALREAEETVKRAHGDEIGAGVMQAAENIAEAFWTESRAEAPHAAAEKTRH
jgi:hypothetical protein